MGALHFRTNCCRQWFKMDSFVCSKCGLVPDRTQHGRLPPWEVAKAIAYSTVITDISEHLGQAANELIGERVDDYIAKKLKLVGGGSPTARAVRHVVARNRNGDSYTGKPCENPRGRKGEWGLRTGDDTKQTTGRSKKAHFHLPKKRVSVY